MSIVNKARRQATEPTGTAAAAARRKEKWADIPVWRRYTPGWLRAVRALVLIACCALIVVPFMSVVSTSLADPGQIQAAGGFVLWPEQPTLDAYTAVLRNGTVVRALAVSIGITAVGTAVSLICTVLLAYSLSRQHTWGHRPILLFVLFTLLFGPGLIPMYLTVKTFGLIDSWWALILPVAVSGFNVLVIRSFMLDVPQEFIDSARVDGAGNRAILLNVMVPLSKAVIAVIGLFYAVSYWNAFFGALLYLNDSTKWPLQLVLRAFVVDNSQLQIDQSAYSPDTVPVQQSIQMAILLLAILPILLVYPFVQRHFTKGVLTGGIKG